MGRALRPVVDDGVVVEVEDTGVEGAFAGADAASGVATEGAEGGDGNTGEHGPARTDTDAEGGVEPVVVTVANYRVVARELGRHEGVPYVTALGWVLSGNPGLEDAIRGAGLNPW